MSSAISAAAKLCGVRVNEFSIGMGPAIWTRQKGETQYSLRALPIGGYCAMEGEDEDTGDERSLTRQGFWKQLIIFAAGALMNFLTGVVILLALYANVTAVNTDQIVGLARSLPSRKPGCRKGISSTRWMDTGRPGGRRGAVFAVRRRYRGRGGYPGR